MRDIIFRGYNRKNEKWLYGFYLQNRGQHFVCPDEFATGKTWEDYEIKPETLGQFTGECDKNDTEIYEGDIVKSYVIKSACVNPDCDPFNLVYEGYLSKETHIVKFENGMFCVDGTPLLYVGLYDLNDIKETLSVSEDEGNCDYHGTIVDESVLGIEVIGNIHDNPELLTTSK